jgi:hydroxymethylbilane synthase
MKLRIGARRSHLARAQAYYVAEIIKNKFSNIEIEFLFKKSLGDINLQDPLWKMPEKGVFTKDLTQDLEKGECDLVVHSWKDLPIELSTHTEIVATTPRASSNDLLIFKKSSFDKLKNPESQFKIFSSSPRRAHNIKKFLKVYLPFSPQKIDFLDIRGNIPTRLEKYISDQAVDGIIVAKAAIDRLLQVPREDFLDLQKEIRNVLDQSLLMVIPLSENPSAAAQGALALECRSDNSSVIEILKSINCEDTFFEASLERKILKSYGGGCHQKLGASVIKFSYGHLVMVKGESPDGNAIELREFHSAQAKKQKLTRSQIWPPQNKTEFFQRKEILSAPYEGNANYWVSRSTALPSSWKIHSNQKIWASGIKTWKALSSNGVWVNGFVYCYACHRNCISIY